MDEIIYSLLNRGFSFVTVNVTILLNSALAFSFKNHFGFFHLILSSAPGTGRLEEDCHQTNGVDVFQILRESHAEQSRQGPSVDPSQPSSSRSAGQKFHRLDSHVQGQSIRRHLFRSSVDFNDGAI